MRSIDNLRDITTFLMMHHSTPTKGFTAKEIAEAVPSLRESSVYRILKEQPQFVQTENSLHPKRYYFDPLKVKTVREAKSKLHIRPELEVQPRPVLEVIENLIKNTKSDPSTPLYNEIRRVALAANNAIEFQANVKPLEPALWENAKNSLDILESFAATLYQRIYELKSDERYNSPEWWALFTKE